MNKISSSDNKPIDILKFPCEFPIKIMGINHPNLIPAVIKIISSHADKFNPDLDISVKSSTKGNYLSITATIIAISKIQLDTIYLELNQHELVKVML